MEVTNIKIGKYYNLSTVILSQYSNGKKGIEKKRLYTALREHFIKVHKEHNP